MSSMDTLDVGQANELKLACRRNDFTAEDLKWLCEGSILADVRRVRLGHATITVTEHIIDCDVDPFNPWEKDGWTVEEHQKGGTTFKWDVTKVELFLSDAQKSGRIEGNQLRKELSKKLVLNACVLDYLLAHPHLIPEEWKGKAVFFWGTIYRRSGGNLYVRYLYWHDVRWHWHCFWLGLGWYDNDPAALRAS